MVCPPLDEYLEGAIWQSSVGKSGSKMVEMTPGNITSLRGKGTLVGFHKAHDLKFIFQCHPNSTLHKDFVG